MIASFITLALIISLFLFLLNKNSMSSSFPKGPSGVPFLGNLLEFRKNPLKAMMKWKNSYGDIVGLRLGSFKAVLISDPKLLKKAFENEAFNGRPEFKPALLFTGGEEHGTLTSTGDAWDEVRKFTIKNLNNLGFGKKSTECLIQEDVLKLIENIKNSSEKGAFEIHDELYVPVSRHLWYLLTGEEMDEIKALKIKNLTAQLHKTLWVRIGSPIWFLPWLTNFFPKLTGWKDLQKIIPKLHRLINEQVQKNLKANESCLISDFLMKISENFNKPSSNFHKSRGEQHMKGMVLNLFITASEAMSNTLNWAFIYLAKYPEEQEKVYNEILEVVGQGRYPTLNDMSKMPYFNAVMKEVLRISSTSPFSNFQMTTQDVSFQGYKIPTNTIVIGNLYGIHHDEKTWSDPEVFRPSRFLASNNPPVSMPFSVGLRTCLGQTYAKNVLFLFLASICQNFRISFEDNRAPSEDELTDECHVSIFRFSKFYKFNFSQRAS